MTCPETRLKLSPGELFDRKTILQIKYERIGDPEKNRIVLYELNYVKKTLSPLWQYATEHDFNRRLEALITDLRAVNESLWIVEDELRLCEVQQEFDERFIQLARSVYKTNDRRAALKKEINALFEVPIYEVKSHA